MNRTQPALKVCDGLGLGGEQVRPNLLVCEQLVESLFVLDQFRAERLGGCAHSIESRLDLFALRFCQFEFLGQREQRGVGRDNRLAQPLSPFPFLRP